jgi:hypothetical protein
MPCGHMCVCFECGEALRNRKHNCPICRGNIGSLAHMKVKKWEEIKTIDQMPLNLNLILN